MDKIKQIIKYSLESNTGKDILTILIVILVGLGSFGLGRLSNDNADAGIKIEYPEKITDIQTATDTTKNTVSTTNLSQTSANSDVKDIGNNSSSTSSLGKAFFASKTGQKYYSIGCSGGKTIKQENRIYFSTEVEAQTAGYEKSSSCK
jgi:hypothetical protein